jgi:RNA polymerase sigma-70 factor (ECF subfamily)
LGADDEKRQAALRDDERALIERARAGEHEAFASLVERYRRRVFSLAFHLSRRPEDVEDLAQQIFLKAYQALPRFDFRAGFGTWLYRIAVNECYDYLRRKSTRKAAEDREVQVGEWAEWERLAGAATAADAERRAQARELAERLMRCLPEQDRILLLLREVEGFTHAEIAHMLGKSENVIKVRLFRARQRQVEAYRRLQAAGAARGR